MLHNKESWDNFVSFTTCTCKRRLDDGNEDSSIAHTILLHQEWDNTRKPLFYLFSRFFCGFLNFIHTRHIFLCVQKPHFYAASHLLKVASHTYKMQLFPPFVVTALSPCIFALSPVVPVEL
jgi:hypothetical protein